MTQHPVRCQKRLKYAVGSAEMGNPDRRIRELRQSTVETYVGRRRGIDFILRALPPRAESRFPA